MAYPPIPFLPDPPLLTDDEAVFDQKAVTFNLALNPWRENVNEAGAYIDSKAAEVEQNAQTANNAASTASDVQEVVLGAANFAGEWSSLTGSLSVPASVLHNGTYWQLLNDLADVTNSEPGVSGDWASINAANFWTPISTSQTLEPSRYYAIDFTSGPLTLTLPVTPANNDFIQFYKSAGEAVDSIIARNGSTIMGLTEDLVIDYDATSLHLVYNGTTWRVVK